jgi:hypothetical protein
VADCERRAICGSCLALVLVRVLGGARLSTAVV